MLLKKKNSVLVLHLKDRFNSFVLLYCNCEFSANLAFFCREWTANFPIFLPRKIYRPNY